jgi:hypothetical protein
MAKKTVAGSGGKSQTGLRESYGRGKQADWSNCDAEILRECIAVVAKTGGALRLGYSRDGGAYAIGVYGDGDPYTLYSPPDDDIDSIIVKITTAFGELG